MKRVAESDRPACKPLEAISSMPLTGVDAQEMPQNIGIELAIIVMR
jgi:hypothetical protein